MTHLHAESNPTNATSGMDDAARLATPTTGSDGSSQKKSPPEVMHLALAGSAKTPSWRQKLVQYKVLLDTLLDHPEREKKDGQCFVPGLLVNEERKKDTIAQLDMAVYDVDGKQSLKRVHQLIENAGYPAIAYTTHSHTTTTTDFAVTSFTTFAKRKGWDLITDGVTAERVQIYLDANDKSYLTNIALVDDSLRVDGVYVIRISHDPVDKCRIVLPLKKPFEFGDNVYKRTAAAEVWSNLYETIGKALGLEYDGSCSDCSRLYYLPAHAPGMPHESKMIGDLMDGDSLLDWRAFEEAAKKHEMVRAIEKTAQQKETYDSIPDMVTDRDGHEFDLKSWFRKHRSDLSIMDAYERFAPDHVIDSGDKMHITCPNESEHDKPGGKGTFCADADPDTNNNAWTISCRHHHCVDHGTLFFIHKAIEDGTFSFADLNECCELTEEEEARSTLQERINACDRNSKASEIESIIRDAVRYEKVARQKEIVSELKDSTGWTLKDLRDVESEERREWKADQKKTATKKKMEQSAPPPAQKVRFSYDKPFENFVEPSNYELERDKEKNPTGRVSVWMKKDGESYCVPVCDRVDFIAHARSYDSTEWMLVCRVTTLDWVYKDVYLPMRMASSEKGLAILRDAGAQIYGAQTRQMSVLLSDVQTLQKARRVDQGGWHRNDAGEDIYIIPGDEVEAFGDTTGEMIIYAGAGVKNPPFTTSGTLEEWQEHVAKPVAGNSRFEFALCMAFAGPLLRPLNIEGGGFNYVSRTSGGKTTALWVCGSVIGGEDAVQNLRSTDNAMEAKFAMYNDLCAPTDEVGQADAPTFGGMIYMLSNGQGKSRLDTNSELKASYEWRMLVLMSGEKTIAQKMAEHNFGPDMKGGQGVRVVDLDADGNKGMRSVEDPHGMDAAAFVDLLKENTTKYHGTALRAYLKYLVEDRASRIEKARKLVLRFKEEVGPKDVISEVKRVSTRFAVVAAGGELAIEAGVLPWEAGTAIAVCKRMFEEWIEARGTGSLDVMEALKRVEAFMDKFSARRFDPYDGGEEEGYHGQALERFGWYKDVHHTGGEENGLIREFYIPIERWREMCGDVSNEVANEAASILADQGAMYRGKDGKVSKTAQPADTKKKRMRVLYHRKGSDTTQKVLEAKNAYDIARADAKRSRLDEGIQREAAAYRKEKGTVLIGADIENEGYNDDAK